jgi:hypothetical protein
VYCTEASLARDQPADTATVVFTQGEFASRSLADEVILRTMALLATGEPSPGAVASVWETVEAASLEGAKAQIVLLGRRPSPN